MSEIEIQAALETATGDVLTVDVIYEHDGHIQINGVWDGDTEIVLTKDQASQIEMACIDDYAAKCDHAQAMHEDYLAQRAEDRRMFALEEQQRFLNESERQRVR